MVKKNIISVGMKLPVTGIKKVNLRSKTSLLDYDIAIIDPSISEFYDNHKDYNGKPCLNDTNSFHLKENLEHWRKEILEAVMAGKNIFLYLNREETVFIATGKKRHSGIGRNRQTTRFVEPISNYYIVPADITVRNANGSLMNIIEKNGELALYWNDLGDASKFRVLLDGDIKNPIIKTKTGNKIAGVRLRSRDSEGNLFLMPYIDFDDPKYEFEAENEMFWTEEACTLAQKIINHLHSISKAVKIADDFTTTPDWVFQNKYILPKEQKTRDKLIVIEGELERLQKQKEQYQQNIISESVLKKLMYEKGKPLEAVVRLALELIGFTASHYEDSVSEFDVIFESEQGRFLGEIEGKDRKAINIDKLRQLRMNIEEDCDREDVSEPAKGILIGNAYRLTDPNERNDFFTERCVTAAQRREIALIRTDHLFEVAKYLSDKSDKRYADACRKAILNAAGQVEFPNLPDPSLQTKYKETNTKQKGNQQTRRITLDIVKQIYPFAKSVHEKKLDISAVQNKLAKDMDPGSAQDYVRAFLHMMKGECYKRTINAPATKYYLKMIHADFGQQALRVALSAVKQHTKYYGDLGYGRLASIENIHREFSKKLQEA